MHNNVKKTINRSEKLHKCKIKRFYPNVIYEMKVLSKNNNGHDLGARFDA